MKISEGQLVEFAKSIELVATKVLEGSHLSRRGGEGVEFHSARPYTDGEDARSIDWKRFAATDKLYVKKFEREEKTGFSIFLDSSPSMSYGSKQLWAQSFVGSLIFLAQIRGDSWRLPPLEHATVEQAYRALVTHQAGGDLQDVVPRRHDRVVVISDFMFDHESLATRLHEWQAQGHIVHLVQILDPQEIRFGFEGVLEFRDFESPGKFLLDSRTVKQAYQSALRELQSEWTSALEEPSFFVTYAAEMSALESHLHQFFERAAA